MPAESAEFLQSFKKALMWASKRRETGWISWKYDYNKDWIDSYSKVHRRVDQQVSRALRETEKMSDGDPEAQPVQKRYVLLDELARRIRDPINLRYQVLGVFLPAQGGTANAVGNVLFELARHPEMWQKLRQDALKLDEPLTFEKLKSLSEFRYVVLETIRLIGPAARVVRYAVRDTTLPSGGGPDRKSPVFVAKGTSVSMSTWGVQHDATIWEDPQQWKPERWRNKKIYWEFVPFSGGPRICPAQQQVLTHTVYMLVRLTQKYESIENCDPVTEFVQKVTVTVESANGVKIKLKPAASERIIA